MYLTDSKLAKKFHLKNLNRKVLQLIGNVELTKNRFISVHTYTDVIARHRTIILVARFLKILYLLGTGLLNEITKPREPELGY